MLVQRLYAEVLQSKTYAALHAIDDAEASRPRRGSPHAAFEACAPARRPSLLCLLPLELVGLVLRSLDAETLASVLCACKSLNEAGLKEVAHLAHLRGVSPRGLGVLWLKQLSSASANARVAMSHSTGLVVDKRDQAHAFGKYHWALGRDATGADNVVANGGDYGTPRPVSALSGVRIARVAVGFNSAFAASETELWCVFGVFVEGSSNAGMSNSIHVYAQTHTRRKRRAWGMNRRGQLATGDRDHRAAPTKVGFPFDGKRIITCLAADDCRAVVVLSGKAYTWGESFAAGRPDVLQPAEVGWPSIEDGAVGAAGLLEAPRPPLVAAYLGCYFAVALDASGSVFWWGEKSLGLEGLEATLRKIPSLRKVVHASVGFKHCLAMTLSGEVYAFGRNTCNQVVALPNTEDMIHSPLKVLGLDQVEVATVYAGGGTSFVVSKCGQVRAWGYGGDGALATGLRHEIRRVGPTVVDSLLGKHVTSLSGSSGFVAVAKDRFGVESYITWGRTAVVVAEKESSRIVLEPHTFALSGLAEKHANAFEAPTLALAAPAPETRAPTPAEPRAPTPSAYVGGALLRFAGPAATALRSGARMLRPCGCKVADCTDQ